MKNKRSFNFFAIGSVGLIAGWLLLFSLVPLLMMVITSFLKRGTETFVIAEGTFQNFLNLLDPLYFQIFLDSFGMALVTTALCLGLGYPFALIIARAPQRFKAFLLLLIIIPFWTSSLIRTYALIAILRTKGLLNQLLLGLGWIEQPLELMYTQTSVLIGLTYSLLPFMVFPLYASIEKLDSRYLEAAMDLGATWRQRFFFITIPLTMPGIISGCTLVFLPALSMFYIPDILGGAKELNIGGFIRNQFLAYRDWPFGAAASVLLTLLMGVMMWGYYRSQQSTSQPQVRL